MSDPGLNHRLRQRSRRSGFMVGATMALTLALCVGAFTVIYAQLEPIVSDFVPRADPIATATSTAELVADAEPTSQAAAPPARDTAAQEPTAAPTTAPIETLAPSDTGEASPTPDDEFTPDYQLSANQPVNLREGPGAEDYDPVTAVPIDAPLMYLDERQQTEDPAGDNLGEGQYWMKFRTEDGDEGWIREIDVTEYEP